MNFDYFRKWCMNKAINIIVVAFFLLFVIFIIFVAGISSGFQPIPASAKIVTKSSKNDDSEEVESPYSEKMDLSEMMFASTTSLSTKKIEWGIKRANNHEQPDLGQTNKKIIDEFDGMAIGNNKDPYIYLTFDVGYEGGFTNKILDDLKSNSVKAAFFVTGQFVKTNPEILQKMIEEGHIVGNHTVNHKSMPECSDEIIQKELMDLHQSIYEKYNYEMKYMRPPKGEYSERSLAYVQKLGYKPVMWSFAYDDWENDKQGREDYGKKKILDNLHNGEIMLLHATSKDNANILDYVIKEIKKQGYDFKTLDEFCK